MEVSQGVLGVTGVPGGGERRGFSSHYLSSHLFQLEPVFKGLVKHRFQSDVLDCRPSVSAVSLA